MKKFLYTLLAAMVLLVSAGCNEQERANTQTITQETYQIQYAFTMLSNDSVGEEWETSVICNGEIIQNGDSITVSPDNDIIIQGEVTEVDAVPDKGSGTMYLKPGDHASGSIEITVEENRGQYIGNISTWQLYCSVTRIDGTVEGT